MEKRKNKMSWRIKKKDVDKVRKHVENILSI